MLLFIEYIIRILAGYLTYYVSPYLITLPLFPLTIFMGTYILGVFISLFKKSFLLLALFSKIPDVGLQALEQKIKSRKLFLVLRSSVYFLVGYLIVALFKEFDHPGLYLLVALCSVFFPVLYLYLQKRLSPTLLRLWGRLSEGWSPTFIKKFNLVMTCVTIVCLAVIFRETIRDPAEKLSPLSFEILLQLDDEFRLTGEANISKVNEVMHLYSKLRNYTFGTEDEYLDFEIRNRGGLTEEIFKNAKRIVIKHAVRVAFHFKSTNNMQNIKAIHSFFTPTNDLGFVGQFNYLLVMDDFEKQLLSMDKEHLSKDEIIEKLVEHFLAEEENPSK